MKPVSKNWDNQLQKIHTYGSGGKFEDHVDSIHANKQVATVVPPCLRNPLVEFYASDASDTTVKFLSLTLQRDPKRISSNVATEESRTVKEVEKMTVHLIVDKNNGAMLVHDTEEVGNEPADGYNTYFVACMIIRSNPRKAGSSLNQRVRAC